MQENKTIAELSWLNFAANKAGSGVAAGQRGGREG
jgi:hypothetical protein